jgi:RNA 2',3'-cyclic 3'-phosphodiesterase
MMSKRLFVAIDLPEAIRKLLHDLNPGTPGVRWTPVEQLHLTVAFFGSVNEKAEAHLREKLTAIEFGAFFLPLTGVGTFPSKGPPRIIWIGVGTGHPHLFQIHKRVHEAALSATLEVELRPWHPHITLGRCGDVSPQSIGKFIRANRDLDLGMMRVEAFHLYSSKLTPAGAVHTRELTVPCKGA